MESARAHSITALRLQSSLDALGDADGGLGGSGARACGVVAKSYSQWALGRAGAPCSPAGDRVHTDFQGSALDHEPENARRRPAFCTGALPGWAPCPRSDIGVMSSIQLDNFEGNLDKLLAPWVEV